jgi:hypothetical protein
MIRDRDRIYGAVVTRRLRAMGIRDKPIAPASPWQNCLAERLIGSIRRECLDHIIVLGEAHLRAAGSEHLIGGEDRLEGGRTVGGDGANVFGTLPMALLIWA